MVAPLNAEDMNLTKSKTSSNKESTIRNIIIEIFYQPTTPQATIIK